MADSSKFADFTEKAKKNIEQIKIGLLRHDKNPQDREFLNDISKSLNSIRKAAIKIGLPRIIELCQSLENLINLIKEEKKELHQEIIITIAASRDRLSKLFFELDTVQTEKSHSKDLVALINSHIDDYNNAGTDQIDAELSETDSTEEQTAIPAEDKKSSLLPQEILNKDYDEELFQIFIEQLQENISLLRTLTDSFSSAPSKDNVMNQCSNLVGKLQSSANYMDYQELAEFYLQWVAELEMAGVELSMGTPVSFDFMDLKIKKIVNLFAELEDKPADPTQLETTANASTQISSASTPEKDNKSSDAEDLQPMFSSTDSSDDDNVEPIAALSGVNSFDESESESTEKNHKSPRKKEARRNKVIEIDGSFLEEEKESDNYDDELFQIFVQQLQENISQLQQLTNSFTSGPNKSNITDKCSNLVGKLQASANYMGYERLAEFYLQWIAELEMIGVELSIGSDISFDFMQEKIDRITSLFPESGGATVAQPKKEKILKSSSSDSITAIPTPVMKLEKTAGDETKNPAFDDLNEDEEIEEPLPEGIEPIAGVFNDEEMTKHKEEPGNVVVNEEGGEFSEAVDEKLESFFADIEEPEEDEDLENSFMAIASLSDEEEEDSFEMATEDMSSHASGESKLFDYDESRTEGIELIAGISDDEPSEETGDGESSEFNDALNDKLESFFGDLKEPGLEEELDTSFMEIASINSENDEDTISLKSEKVSNGEIEDLFEDEDEKITESEDFTDALVKKEAIAESNAPEGGEFSDAVDEKLESLFADFDDSEEDEELETSFMEIASTDEEESEEKPVAFTAEPPDDDDKDLDDEEEEPLGEGIESIASLYDEEEVESDAATEEKTEGDDFGDAVDEKLESFFTDLDEPESDDEFDTALAEQATLSESIEEEETLAEETIATAEIPEDELAEPEEIASALFEDEPEAPQEESETGDFSDAIDEKLESFFTDLDEPESDDEFDTAVMEQATSTESIEEEETLAEETIATAEIPEDELAEPEEIASALFEDEPEAPQEESETGDFSDAIDEKLESFFTDLDEPESDDEFDTAVMEQAPSTESIEEDILAEETITTTEIPEEGLAETEEIASALFEDESEAPKEEPETGDFSDAMDEKLESFFTDLDETDATLESEEPPDDIITGETDEITEGFDHLTIDEESSDEEQVKDIISISEEIVEEDETISAPAEELLSDEELLQEIEGPMVGEEITTDTESLLPEIEIPEKVVSALSDDDLTEKELFQKLEGAIAEKEDETSDIEGLDTDEEIFDESTIDASVIETAPERKELFQKLSSALHSLDDEETGELETVEEADARDQEPEFDNQLFDKLVNALETPSEQVGISDVKPMDQVLEEILSSTPVETRHTEPPSDYIPKKLAASEIKQMISMDTDKVDHLMNQVGELNTNRSTLKQLFAEMNDLHHHYLKTDSLNKKELKPFKDLIFRLGDTSVSLNRLSSEIREGVLKVRMVPIGLLFDRYHEFVNNLTSGTNKQVEIEIIGEDTELEKIVIDEISEPLTHIISNVVEHAIESIDERKSLGKNEVAKLKLEAYQENNEIVIEVTDDGRGIDLKKVKAKALEQGLFTSEELYQMSESDLKRLILNPEFSTVVDKGKIPEDRGEGLHIVQTNIEKLKGSIDIRSKEGQGTIIQVKVPLNLLVVKALKIKAGKEIMALPVSCIEEILKVQNDVIFEKDGNKFINVHETTLPVFKLTEVFNIETDEDHDERVYIITVQAENQSIGLIVDETFGLEEIIIKPLGEFLRKESGFAGATIITDGNISLVPDVAELIRIATKRQPVPEKSVA